MIIAEIEAEDFLQKQGFYTSDRKIVGNEAELNEAAKKFGFPCILKVSSSHATHKAAINGIKIIYNQPDISRAWAEIKTIAEEVRGKVLLQKFVKGKEILIGLKKDPVFGHVLLAGIGGSLTEIIHDISFRILDKPIDEPEAMKMLKELKNFRLLESCNLKLVAKTIAKMSMIPGKFPDITELDINPLIANEKEAIIVDARIVRK